MKKELQRAFIETSAVGDVSSLLLAATASLARADDTYLHQLTTRLGPEGRSDIQSFLAEPSASSFQELVVKIASSFAEDPLPRHPSQVRAASLKKVRSRTSDREVRTYPSSPALALGERGHKAVEMLENAAGKSEALVRATEPQLLTDGQVITGVAFLQKTSRKNKNYDPKNPEPYIHINFPAALPRFAPRRNIFSRYLIPPEPPQVTGMTRAVESDDLKTVARWAVTTAVSELAYLKLAHPDGLPYSARGVERFLKVPGVAQSLQRLSAVSVVLLGPEVTRGLNLLTGSGAEREIRDFLTSEGLDFTVISLLSVGGKIEQFGRNGSDFGVFTEVKIPPVAIVNGTEKITLAGGEMDVLEVRFNAANTISAAQVVDQIKAKFGSQENRYRARDAETGGLNTRLTASFSRCLLDLMSRGGFQDVDVFLRQLDLTVVDSKFVVGDARTWQTSINVHKLPYPEHISQVQEYLLFVAIHLLRLKKAYMAEKAGHVPNGSMKVSREEIASFILDYSLGERLRGRVDYQIPGQVAAHPLALPTDTSGLLEWMEAILTKRAISPADLARASLFKALELVVRKAPQTNAEQVAVNHRRPPEHFQNLCLERHDVAYLSLETLSSIPWDWCVQYQEQGVYVLQGKWADAEFRLSISAKGEFWLKSGLHEFGGLLLDDLENIATDVDVQAILTRFAGDILPGIGNFQRIEKTNNGDVWKFVLNTQTNTWSWVNKAIPGKPAICRYHPFKDTWTITLAAAQEGLVECPPRYTHHVLQAIRVLEGTHTSGNIFCPLHDHNDGDTPAVSIRPNGWGCWGCDRLIRIEGRVSQGRTTVPIETIASFASLPIERQVVIDNTLELSRLFYRYFPDGANYLQTERGIKTEPGEDIGFLPGCLTQLLIDISYDTAMGKFDPSQYPLLNRIEAIGPYTQRMEEVLISLPDYPRKVASQILNLYFWERAAKDGYLLPIKHRVIRDGDQERTLLLPSKNNFMGDRVLFPTYWPDKTTGVLKRRGFNGRATGKSAIKQVKQPVARMSEEGGDPKRLLNPSPPGFYFPEPERFIEMVRATGMAFLFEGPINARSFKEMYEHYSGQTVAMCGKTYLLVQPFFRWVLEATGLAPGELEIVLATDFDEPGVEAAGKLAVVFQEMGLSTWPVVELLEQDFPTIRQVLEEDPHRDMNDLWLMILNNQLESSTPMR